MNYKKDEVLFKAGKRYRLPMDSIESPNMDIVEKLIEKHKIDDVPHHKNLQKYYVGKHDILNRRFRDPSKPNQKLVNPFGKLITDQLTSYFVGKPVRYTAEKETKDYLERLQFIFDINNESAHNSEMAKTASINGVAYELLWVDEKGIPRFNQVPINEMLVVYDNKLDPQPLMAVRHYTVYNYLTEKEEIMVEIYTKNAVFKYVKGEKDFVEQSVEPHYFGNVPVIPYFNNQDGLGDWQVVTPLIDAYDTMQSDTANDFEYFADAYLALKGVIDTQPEDISEMKENRVMLLGEQGDAQWLVKQTDFTSIDGFKKRITDDIFRFSGTVDMAEIANVSNISGVAIQYKLLSTEALTANKERQFRKSLMKRIELITAILNLQGHNFIHTDVEIQFIRNIPQNIQENIQLVSQLFGTVSHKTLLSQLPFIADPEMELQMLNEEKQNQVAEDYEFPLEVNTEGESAE
ncbi:phage portal protein [Cytobacillus kochii]|uniref:phage portal protein n=1 Tax=Cytobacillus kochii TaxID=859143 RepID=UPI001CD71C56|nr:phage portal protein [Cytobacillus kochii]MCA1025777.1 phage portal protein [Cytobacillus kochii]